MEIKIKKNKFQMYSIIFGRELPNCSSVFLITICLEDYNEHREVVYASMIKGLFREKRCK